MKLNDFVLHKHEGGNMTGGMLFNNYFNDNQMPAMLGGAKHDISIPMGLVLYNNKMKNIKSKKHDNDSLLHDINYVGGEPIKASLYDKLLNMYDETKQTRDSPEEESQKQDVPNETQEGGEIIKEDDGNEMNGGVSKKNARKRRKRKSTRKKKIKMKLRNKTRKL